MNHKYVLTVKDILRNFSKSGTELMMLFYSHSLKKKTFSINHVIKQYQYSFFNK